MFNQHYFPQNLTDFQLPHSDCLHEWILKEGSGNIPYFSCGSYLEITKWGTCKNCKRQMYNLHLKQNFNITIPKTYTVKGSTQNLLLETRVSVLETQLNLLETELATLRQHIEDQADSKQKCPLHVEEGTELVFIKTPIICNTGRFVDIRVQCTLNIQGHELSLQAFIDSSTTNSTIDKYLLWSTNLWLVLNLMNKNLLVINKQKCSNLILY